MKSQILIAIDDAPTLDAITQTAKEGGYITYSEKADSQAVSILQSRPIDVAIIDLESPSVEGLEILRSASLKVPSVPVVIVGGHTAAKSAIASLRINVADYVNKPIAPEALHNAILRALEQRQMFVKMNRAVFGLDIHGFGGLLGVSTVMQDVFDQIRHCAPFKATVLITGESGTGKDLVAKALHAFSPHVRGPFLAINCSAIPRELVESQLFGYEKGAFTGAESARQGLFEAANGGTLFLDEIGDLAPDAQAKLLRTLEERQVTRLGSIEPIDINVRLIAATNTNLKHAVEEHHFRTDLYYRLDVLHIHLAPLRERKEDIPLLLRAFLDRFAQENRATPKTISPDALACLVDYPWPGNVRELKNIAERLAIIAERDTIDLRDIPEELRPVKPRKLTAQKHLGGFKSLPLVEMEKILIENTLEQNGGNRVVAAEILGISQRTLQRKMKEFNLLA